MVGLTNHPIIFKELEIMKYIKGNMWDIFQEFDITCINTNGFVKKDGTCVMGRGCAKEARDMFSGIATILGTKIKTNGNKVQGLLRVGSTILAAFPTKHVWWEESSVEVIDRSCVELKAAMDKVDAKKVLLPYPGIGNGKLSVDVVQKILDKHFKDDDRLYVIRK